MGTVRDLWRYPIKSLRAEELAVAEVTPEGFAGDRRRALFATSEGHARTGKYYRGKEDSRLHTVTLEQQAVGLAGAAGICLDGRGAGPYYDTDPYR